MNVPDIDHLHFSYEDPYLNPMMDLKDGENLKKKTANKMTKEGVQQPLIFLHTSSKKKKNVKNASTSITIHFH